jgi:hypothetical protein
LLVRTTSCDAQFTDDCCSFTNVNKRSCWVRRRWSKICVLSLSNCWRCSPWKSAFLNLSTVLQLPFSLETKKGCGQWTVGLGTVAVCAGAAAKASPVRFLLTVFLGATLLALAAMRCYCSCYARPPCCCCCCCSWAAQPLPRFPPRRTEPRDKLERGAVTQKQGTIWKQRPPAVGARSTKF